jgi:hypothetical protein
MTRGWEETSHLVAVHEHRFGPPQDYRDTPSPAPWTQLFHIVHTPVDHGPASCQLPDRLATQGEAVCGERHSGALRCALLFPHGHTARCAS